LQQSVRHFEAALRYATADEKPKIAVDLGMVYLAAGRRGAAIAAYRDAIAARPRLVEARVALAQVLASGGEQAAAMKEIEQALSVRSNWPPALRIKAWVLATAPDAGLRKPAEAVAIAERLVQTSPKPDAALFDTLAAAQAAAGRMPAAVQAAKQGIAFAEKAGNARLAGQIGARLKLYEAGRPYRDTGEAAQK
jgi:tetratricopeptide (TPR) repeat protein